MLTSHFPGIIPLIASRQGATRNETLLSCSEFPMRLERSQECPECGRQSAPGSLLVLSARTQHLPQLCSSPAPHRAAIPCQKLLAMEYREDALATGWRISLFLPHTVAPAAGDFLSPLVFLPLTENRHFFLNFCLIFVIIHLDISDNFLLCIFIRVGWFFPSNIIRFVLNSKVSSYTSTNQCNYIDFKDCSIFR